MGRRWPVALLWASARRIAYDTERAGQVMVAAGLVVIGGALVAEFVVPFVALGAVAVLVGAPGEGIVEGLAHQR
jgi:hypothetical protein